MTSPMQDHTASRSPRDVPRIVVDPTPDNQRIYNDIRRTHERTRLQTHVAEQQNHLRPPVAQSVSTVNSPIDEPISPSIPDTPVHDTDRPKKPRGRRKGPLSSDTRLNTAVKRKLKLTCPHHRAKKITCNCHDFSQLEEGYHSSQLQPPASRRRSDQSDILSPSPASVRTFNNRETFGAGGAAEEPSDEDTLTLDIDILQSSAGDQEGRVRPNVQQIVDGFDTRSVHLGEGMRQVRDQPYHPGNEMGGQSPRVYSEDELFEIGSQNPDYPNRWHCSYKGSADAPSGSSSECHWSGAIHLLRDHFRTYHHPFHDASPPTWQVCTHCRMRVPLQDNLESPLSPSRNFTVCCSRPSFEKWYCGSTRDESIAGSMPGLTTQSSESDAGFSCNLRPDGDLWPSGGGGTNGGYNPFPGGGGSHGPSSYHNAKWDTSSESSDQLSDCCRHSRGCPLYLALKDCTVRHPSDSGMKICYDITQANIPSRRCPMRLLSYVRLSIGHLLAISLPILVTTMIRENGHLLEPNSSSFRESAPEAISWWWSLLLLLGFVMTWILKHRVKSRIADESHRRARDRQHLETSYHSTRFRHDVVLAL